MSNRQREENMEEHILVCISPAPSNPTIIQTAARMAKAFQASFSALYVRTPDLEDMPKEAQEQLQYNIRLARKLGADVETVYGDDIPLQIAEFARLSRVTQIVIGRSIVTKRHMIGKLSLTDRLIARAPEVDVHIIPDAAVSAVRFRRGRRRQGLDSVFRDILGSVLILIAVSSVGALFDRLDFAEANIIMVYILGVLLTAVTTRNRIYSLISSIVSVVVFNFLFTEPRYTLMAYSNGYPVTFLVMFLVAFITGSFAIRMKEHVKQSTRAAYRTQILLDTNRLLQHTKNREEIVSVTAKQLNKLLDRDIVMYLWRNGALSQPYRFPASGEFPEECVSGEERKAAEWTAKHNKSAGATTKKFPQARCLYLAIRINNSVYGVVGIVIGDTPLEAFENSIMLSIVGECALSLENEKNAREKEEAAVLMRNEQLRANLLRGISHDLRTPLTSISGNASNLLANGDSFPEEVKKKLYTDIYDDAMWLINLVENLLSVTRLGEGRTKLNISSELVDDVIAEALRHISRQSAEHTILVGKSEDFLLARMDAKLIVQVLINLVDNAVKYTQKGSEIHIDARHEGDFVAICVSDNGPGIPDEAKPRVFDMFYTGANEIADSRRSLGMGLALCRSIVAAHGGTITVSDSRPHGTAFTFTLPAGEVVLYE